MPLILSKWQVPRIRIRSQGRSLAACWTGDYRRAWRGRRMSRWKEV